MGKNIFKRVLNLISILAIMASVVIPAYYFGDMPDDIPRHYDLAGNPDAWSGKWIIWILPLINLGMFIGLSVLEKFSDKLNLPFTTKNSAKQRSIAITLIKSIKAIICSMFCYMTIGTVANALGWTDRLMTEFLPVALGLIFLTVAVAIWRSFLNK